MDLSFFRFDSEVEIAALPPDLALLMVDMASRQASSPTAMVYARTLRAPVDATLFAPVDGAFNGPVAIALMKWKHE